MAGFLTYIFNTLYAAWALYLLYYLYSLVVRRIRNTQEWRKSSAIDPPTKKRRSGSYVNARYEPTIGEVLLVKSALHTQLNLPYEIVDFIIDLAEYWPHTSTSLPSKTVLRSGVGRENQLVLRTLPIGFSKNGLELGDHSQVGTSETSSPYVTWKPKPWPSSYVVPSNATTEVLNKWTAKTLPKGKYPVRKIVFTIESHDQGWGGENRSQRGTYEGSFSWFDVGHERFSAHRAKPSQNLSKSTPTPQFTLEPLNLMSVGSIQQSPVAKEHLSGPISCSLCTLIPSTVKLNPEGDETSPDSEESGQSTPVSGATSSPSIEPTDKTNTPLINPNLQDTIDSQYTFNHEMLPSPKLLQRNLVATRNTTKHVITWSHDDNIDPDSVEGDELEQQGRGRKTGDGSFVRGLRVGDTVTVWAKARFHGWANFIDNMKIDIYWAV